MFPNTSSVNPDDRNLGIESVLDNLLSNLGQDFVTILVGAAISISPPSDLPDVKTFYQQFSTAIIKEDQTPTELKNLNQLLWENVPFERLMQSIHDVLRDSRPTFIPNLLVQIYGRGEPNKNHQVLAELLLNQRIQLILTTNFDELIERTDPRIRQVVTEQQFAQLSIELTSGVVTEPTVAHLHGLVSNPSSLVALMNQVGKTIEGSRRSVLEKTLEKGVLVTLGYSGSDQDINPVLKLYPPERQWHLVRRSKVYKQYEQPVELNPTSNIRTSATEPILNSQLDLLKQSDSADLLKLIGTVSQSAGMGVMGSKRLQRGQNKQWTASGAVMYATALASEHLYTTAIQQLSQNPDDQSLVGPRWIANRAFYKRHIGRFHEFAQDYAALQDELEKQFSETEDQELIPEILNTIWHEIEVLVLLASSQPRSERGPVLARCDTLLQYCREWISRASQLPPTSENDFYEAEIALLKGDAKQAAASYEKYQKSYVEWFGPSAITLGALRKAVALRGNNDWIGALKSWIIGIKNAWLTKSFTAIIQYLIVSPILLGAPTGWYWFTRRIATRLYPIYEAVKIRWLRFTQPDFLS